MYFNCFSMPKICAIYIKFSYSASHYSSYGRFRFKSGNLEHPGDVIRNASVEVLPLSALAQAHKMPGLIYNRPFSKMAAKNLNKSKLETNTSTRKSILNLATLHTNVCKFYNFQLKFSQLIFHLKC